MNAQTLEVRRRILQIAHRYEHGHLPTCFSVIEMLYAIYSTMSHRPQEPDWPERDVFVLSKGHAALGLYAVLAEFGYFTYDEIRFGQFQSPFGCHADRLKIPGVEVSTGSLGHGIAVAGGIALGMQIDGSARRCFTLVGDGESNEGSVWEAVSTATHLKLSNLTILYDNNGSQTRCQPIPNPVERFNAFGCEVLSVNGHDIDQLVEAIGKPSTNVKAIVANTVKGHGCRTFVEEMFAWHHRYPKEDELVMLLEELNEASF